MNNSLTNQQHRLYLARILLCVAAALFGPMAAAQIAMAQEDVDTQLTVVAPALNVRTGPDVSFPSTGYLLQGDVVSVLAYDAEADWWQIEMPETDSTIGWISGGDEYVSIMGDSLPIDLVAAAESATIAPATETLVFQSTVGGPIYAINPAGTNLRYITTGLDPTLSPNGQQIAFTRWAASQDGTLGSVWLINSAGTDERILLDNILQPRSPVWSADGSQLAISMQRGGLAQPEHTCGNQRPPRNASDIETEKDGRKVLKYCYTLPADPHWGLRIVDVATGQFTDPPHDIYSLSPAWDPVNDWRVVYDGDRGLVNVDLKQGTTWPLTTDVNDRSPVFSPDGTKLATSYWQHDHWEVHTLNADGTGRVRLTETPWTELVRQNLAGETLTSWHNAAPVWSPDGSQIAFLTDRSGIWEIWVMHADGSKQHPFFPADILTEIELQYGGLNERALSWR